MTKLLLKYCMPKTENTHAAIGALAGITGIGCNGLLAGAKLAVGWLTGSVAIIGDGINNLTDSASSVVTLLGFRMSRRPADREHPYGHGRYEYLAGLTVAALVLLAGGELALSSIQKILHPQAVPFSFVTLAVLLLSAAVKLWMAHFYRTTGNIIHSRTLLAAAIDSRNDVIATGAVIISFVLESALHIHMDGIVGLGVAAFILWSGVGLAKETVSPLLGSQADEGLVRELTELVLAHKRVLGIHDLLIHDYGPGRCFASLHAEINAAEAPLEAHDLLDHIEQEAQNRLNVQLVIHWDPVVKDDSELERLQAMAEAAAAGLDDRITIHDLRIVRYDRQPRLSFDASVPYETAMTDDEIICHLETGMADSGMAIKIKIDRGE